MQGNATEGKPIAATTMPRPSQKLEPKNDLVPHLVADLVADLVAHSLLEAAARAEGFVAHSRNRMTM